MTVAHSTPVDRTLLDPKLLRLLDALHSTGSVTRAALRLGQSQPTVSIWLAQARAALGDPLYVRTPSGMLPTPRMEALLPTVRDILAAMERLHQTERPFDPSSARRSFRIFMTDASHITLLPRLFSHVHASAPGVAIEAATIGADMASVLQAGEADLALGLIPGLESGFYQQALYDQDWVCLCHPRHPRLGQTLTRRQYEREAHVGIVRGTGQDLLDAALDEHAVERRVLLRLPGFLGLSAILSQTDLVATLPRQIGETLAAAASLRVLRCPIPVAPFTVKQHWHHRLHQDNANRWLRGVVAELFMQPRRPARSGSERMAGKAAGRAAGPASGPSGRSGRR